MGWTWWVLRGVAPRFCLSSLLNPLPPPPLLLLLLLLLPALREWHAAGVLWGLGPGRGETALQWPLLLLCFLCFFCVLFVFCAFFLCFFSVFFLLSLKSTKLLFLPCPKAPGRRAWNKAPSGLEFKACLLHPSALQVNAISTFNILNQEGRKVVGALFPAGQ
jgi:hypothetical protein